MIRASGSVEDRLLFRLQEDENGCWLWQGWTDPTGYGRISVNGRREYVHRLSYKLFQGPIPAGMEIDHLCRVRNCAQPDHLEAVVRRVNMERGLLGERWRATECVNGHPKMGGECRDCARARKREWARRNRAAVGV